MHGAAFASLRLPHTYEAVRARYEDLPSLVEQLRRGVFAGLNVTIPHKRHVLELVDAVDPSAAVVGAANTLVREPDGRVVAYNTDVPALAAELGRLAAQANAGSAWRDGRALVLGTGGTARSAVVALAFQLGMSEIVVRGRAFENMSTRDRFCAEMGELLSCAGADAVIYLETWKPSAQTERGVTAIVQATSAGMQGADPGDASVQAIAWPSLAKTAVALDVVYAPPETPFVRAARSSGLLAAGGLGMLARQGALAFERWLGMPAPYDAMVGALG